MIPKTRRFRPLLAALAMLALPAAQRPADRPATRGAVEGVIRFSGPAELAPLLARWQQAFRRANPAAEFGNRLNGRDAAIYGIEMRTADIALLDRPINPFERYGTYEHSWIFPVEIEIATDGMLGRESPATEAVFVHADNPLPGLTIAQLDGIFGAERDGGFDKLDWNTHAARPAAANIRQWAQLGMTGTLAAAPIHVYGPASHGNGVITYFQQRVLQGGSMRNADLREYADPAAMFAAMTHDPQAIGYGPLGAMPPGFRPVALAADAAGPYVRPTADTLRDRRYPLARPIYLYFTIDTTGGQLADPRVDPKVMAFVTYILSPAGQAEVRRDGRYQPLTPEQARRQLAILTLRTPPPERPL